MDMRYMRSSFQIVRHITRWKKALLQCLEGHAARLDCDDLDRTDWQEVLEDRVALGDFPPEREKLTMWLLEATLEL